MIDLHSHTNRSDGTCSPAELVQEALRVGLEALGITDHDTFAGYDEALPHARDAGLEIVCGIELSTKLNGQSVHLLGYFPREDGINDFRKWVLDIQAGRRERNIRLISRLRNLGFDITLEEAEARGRGMTGRPHFAQIMVEKGYVTDYQQAFDEYLDESARGYVFRREPQLSEAVTKIRNSGGIASLAHPIRIKQDLHSILPGLCDAGLNAIEVYHSDHSQEQADVYLELARDYRLLVTGGSDFHGTAKQNVKLGTGRDGNLDIPANILHRLLQT